ncbi:uncharacterized protein LOC108914015 [Anoplophora glabripennis]|uniref:uncharacterized protein LOC108914015 n=1 Tax=Anoplophora glabripennis TaxID=217634 RepID=UPI000874409D|nr:uncharacterized protein LOC108914015 [Anoplophora glabripennis]
MGGSKPRAQNQQTIRDKTHFTTGVNNLLPLDMVDSKPSLVLSVQLLKQAEDKSQPKIVKSEYKKSLSRDCINAYSATCLKLDILSWVDKLNEEDDYSVLPGVSVIRENNSVGANTADLVAELARDFPNDPDARLDAFLIKKVTSYFNSHSIRLHLLDQNTVETARGGGGGGGGGGGNKGGGGMGNMGGMILAAGAMMKGTLMALALGGIAALAGKALMTGLISLLLSAIIGLKALTHGHKSTTYEIVSKPIYSHSNTHSVSHEDHGHGYGHSSYGRSFNMPLPLGLQPDYNPEIK